MQVSKLEIKGFKSFGDKVTIHFNEGITGIVGPNGCGKSNIVDAIRWVLGEQKTRNLRSEKMENVIFNGSKNRKPQQLAEVSLTFDNNKNILPTEYSQVTVTRRYFRNGDSEYLLNNVTCRLKDITDLFLDTGIGSDSYAIIELKMVDEILNDKENSRRTLFEEAAGISKFKVRKKQTLKKLEETDADLERVEDVLFEIAKNLKSLERQAKVYERYSRLKEEYKTFSLEYARRNIAQHLQTLDRLETDLHKEADQKLNFAKELEELENALFEQKTILNLIQEQLAGEQRNLNEQTTKIRQLENDLKLKSERINYLKERLRTLHQQINIDSVALTQSQESIVQLHEEIEELQTQYAGAEQQVSLSRRELEQANQHKTVIQNTTQELTNQQRAKQNTVFQLRKDMEITQMQIVNLTNEMERITQAQQNDQQNADKYRTELTDLEESLTQKNNELANLQEQEEQLRADISQSETDIQTLRTQLQEVNRKTDAKKNQYNLTKSLVENLEGFPEAIKFLYKSKNWQKPAPLLSDLIVCDQEYKALIESYLEPYMNFFVVETVEDALEAIQLLNNQNKGRANFIILAEMEDLEASPTASTPKYKAAYEVVSAEEKYHNLVRYILQEVYISHDSTPDFYSQDNRTFILKDGSVIKKPLSISGGSVGLFDGNRIGRKQNLENLAQELQQLMQDAELLKVKINTQQQVLLNYQNATQQSTIKQLEKNISGWQQELVAVRVRHEQHELLKANSQNKVQELTSQLKDLRYKSYELGPQVETEQQELKRLENEIQAFSESLTRQNEVIQNITTLYNQENIKYHQLKNRLGSVQQEINYKQKSFETNSARLRAQEEELGSAEEEIYILEEFIQENSALLDEFNIERQKIAQNLDQVEKEFFTVRGEIDLKDKNIRELQRKRQNADEIVASVQQAANETKIKLVAVRERLLAEFTISEEEIMQTSGATLDLPTDELNKQIAEIKIKLDNVGPVNPTAAQAYDEINERHNFIKIQREDLFQAKEALLQTINEIDTVAKQKYLDSFEMIKNNFVRVFQSLFSEDDSCDLVIADPANPLESKIEIIARPKGKRPLTINQLSGGEKTLTAISLLFAIYLLKPAPFCIFDEVDAPLDDANIDKFNNIVKKFSGESQFIVVTHNKRTMVSTDIIYGVTMLEPGVSRVIPVDLRQLA
ncbi:chromosome segregation protein SMC [Adhaeribacter arboris]|uniref:Chromosome partition protein Smc n=1 Tax=Adhaeribacter arboris TaxID=2072846 RepID=A0A2T2YCE6_9BACT|nr:chromosome segregation protein SMC [Adhaeribacter arboris]PSR53174.1 chromosome segregation protein SMC [Adhaeribacter arboris]